MTNADTAPVLAPRAVRTRLRIALAARMTDREMDLHTAARRESAARGDLSVHAARQRIAERFTLR